MSEPANSGAIPAYLVIDTESVPDGRLVSQVKYPQENLPPEVAISRAQDEARSRSPVGSDFLPVSLQIPVAICVLRVGGDFSLQEVTCLDAPQFRPQKIVEAFWTGASAYRTRYGNRIHLVTFNGRGFDLPLLELAAFRYGVCARDHFVRRHRFDGWHIDLLDWLTNFGAYRLSGGLNLLSKLLGKPGKMEVQGYQVYQMFVEGKLQQINDYCLFDTLDTYFVFLRTRVLAGQLTLQEEHELVIKAKSWIIAKAESMPALKQYLDNWGDWQPWP